MSLSTRCIWKSNVMFSTVNSMPLCVCVCVCCHFTHMQLRLCSFQDQKAFFSLWMIYSLKWAIQMKSHWPISFFLLMFVKGLFFWAASCEMKVDSVCQPTYQVSACWHKILEFFHAYYKQIMQMKQAFTYWIKSRFIDQQSYELNRLCMEGVLGWFYLNILISTLQFHTEWRGHVCYIMECDYWHTVWQSPSYHCRLLDCWASERNLRWHLALKLGFNFMNCIQYFERPIHCRGRFPLHKIIH